MTQEQVNAQEINQIKTSYNKAIQTLKDHIAENEALKKEVDLLHHYYNSKFANQFEKLEDKELAIDLINDLIFSQIASTYWLIGTEIEEDIKKTNEEELVFTDKVLAMPKGILRNVLGSSLEGLYKDSNWYMFKGNEETNLRILNELSEGFETYRYILELAACYGAYLAVIHSDIYKNHPARELEGNSELKLLLADMADLSYLSPEVYMQYNYHNETSECWNLFVTESSRFSARWIGSVTHTKLAKHNLLVVQVENIISLNEKSGLCKELAKRLPKEQLKETQLQMSHLSEEPALFATHKFLNY